MEQWENTLEKLAVSLEYLHMKETEYRRRNLIRAQELKKEAIARNRALYLFETWIVSELAS